MVLFVLLFFILNDFFDLIVISSRLFQFFYFLCLFDWRIVEYNGLGLILFRDFIEYFIVEGNINFLVFILYLHLILSLLFCSIFLVQLYDICVLYFLSLLIQILKQFFSPFLIHQLFVSILFSLLLFFLLSRRGRLIFEFVLPIWSIWQDIHFLQFTRRK